MSRGADERGHAGAFDQTAVLEDTDAATTDREAVTSADTTVGALGGGVLAREHFPATTPDRYRAGAEVGRGGIGRVVRAHDRVLDREVAIKELHATTNADQRRFVREALITSRLQHPSIVPIYEAGRWADSGAPFYAMKLVNGSPLHASIDKAKTLAARLALVPVVLAVADAIAYAHSKRIVHRDLKPANILVGEFGETVVIDWGLAKDLSIDDRDALDAGPYRESHGDQTMVGALLGTPAYMAPEQAAGRDVDERADVYALGAILYHVLAGVTPHEDASLDAIIVKILEGTIVPIEQREPHVPADLAALVGKAMHREPARRYPTAKELADDLRRYLAGQLVGSYRYSRWELVRRFVRRHRAVVVAIAIAFVVLGVAVYRIVDERDRADRLAQLALERAREADEQRQRAIDRAELALLAKARLLAETDPAAAVVSLIPLAHGKHWREVRAVAMHARASGVPWKLAGPALLGAQYSPDGERLAGLDADGQLHVHQLRDRTLQSKDRFAAAKLLEWLDDERVAIYDGAELVTYTLATGARDAIAAPPKLDWLSVDRGVLYATDTDRRMFRLDIGSRQLVPVELPTDVKRFAFSPDGTRIAVTGQGGLWLVDRANTVRPERLLEGPAFSVAWSEDSKHLLVGRSSSVASIRLGPPHDIHTAADVPSEVAIANTIRYTVGLSGLRAEGQLVPTTSFNSINDSLGVTRDGFAIRRSERELAVVDGERFVVIPLPIRAPSRIVVSKRSPYVVALIGDAGFVWSFEHVMPRKIPMPPAVQVARLGGREILHGARGRQLRRVDPATGKAHELDYSAFGVATSVSPSGTAALLLELDRVSLLRAGSNKVEPLTGIQRHTTFVDDERVATVDDRRRIRIVELAGSTTTQLAELDIDIIRITANARWIVCSLHDGTLWRMNLATRAIATHATNGNGRLLSFTEPTDDGTVWFADKLHIRKWASDGAVTVQATLPSAIDWIIPVTEQRALARSTSGTYIVQLDAPERVIRTIDVDGVHASHTGLVASSTQRGTMGITMLDVPAASAWTMARSLPGGSYASLTHDGAFAFVDHTLQGVGETMEGSHIDVWPVDLPQSPDELARWLERLTNARYDPATDTIMWP